MLWHPPETIITNGNFDIRTYGLLLALAIVTTYSWAEYRAKKNGLTSHLASDVFFWAIIGAMIGARLGFVIQELGYFQTHLAEVFAVRAGGLSFHGGLVGGLLAGLIVLKKHQAMGQFWLLADAAATPLLLGAAIGRLGNWANQELYGYPTSLPWGITIDPAHRLPGYESFTTFHPTFAYEAILNLIGLLILIILLENGQKFVTRHSSFEIVPAGASFLFALAWYSLARGITEIWRISDRLAGSLSLAQLISIGLISICAAVYLRQHLKIKN